jgi:hypothetical protein
VGGDQDRTIGEEIIIAADGKPVPIDVFCVEHGRWGGRAEAEYASLVAAGEQRPFVTSVVPIVDGSGPVAAVDVASVEQIAAAANAGKFVGSVGSLNKQARVAVQKGEGQQAVWDKVAKQNAKAGVETESGTFASNYSDADTLDRLEPYFEHVKQPIDESPNVVGVIVAVNGKVESMDVFESTPLFRKLWPKLLKSYALDATGAADADAEKKVATRADAIAFFQDVAAAKTTTSKSEGNLAISHAESDRVLLFSAHEPRGAELMRPAASMDASVGGFGGGLGGAVHASGYAQ